MVAFGVGVVASPNQPAIGPGFSTRPTTTTASATTTARTIEATFVLEKIPGPESADSVSTAGSAAAFGAAGGRAPPDSAGTAGRAVFKGTEAFPYASTPLAAAGVGAAGGRTGGGAAGGGEAGCGGVGCGGVGCGGCGPLGG
ncbi:hypothetical protein L3i22_104270 [Actinoplanes sp. L3-i22]|nr:hypothetical protein L3i22_104270 [Actinoplanes sp. L3-i22]